MVFVALVGGLSFIWARTTGVASRDEVNDTPVDSKPDAPLSNAPDQAATKTVAKGKIAPTIQTKAGRHETPRSGKASRPRLQERLPGPSTSPASAHPTKVKPQELREPKVASLDRNKAVSPSGRWMAQPTVAESQRIEKIFAEQRQRKEEFDRTDRSNHARRFAIEKAKEIVENCYEDLRAAEPAREGRVIVHWTLHRDGNEAVCTEARIGANVGLRHPAFVSCILDDLIGSRILATTPEELTVEYPFFLSPAD